MSILLIGEHYAKNLGDPLISECYQMLLKKYDIAFEILDLSGRKKGDSNKLHKVDTCDDVKRIVKRKEYNYISAIINSIRSKKIMDKVEIDENIDAAIYVGGSLFMGYFATRQYYLNKKLISKKIPIFYSACGMGDISFGFEKRLLKKALQNIQTNRIMLRDSEENFYQEFKIRAQSTQDIALLVSEFNPVKYNPEIEIGIGFMSLNKLFDEELEKSYIGFISLLEEKQIKWELFTNGALGDYDAMKLFYFKLKDKGLAKYGGYCLRPRSTIELINHITKYKKIITCRLHSAIISYSYQIPTLAIDWSNKVVDFYKHIKHDEMIIHLGFNPQEIYNVITNINYTEKDAKCLKDLQLEASSNVHNILGEIEKIKHGEYEND